MTALMSPKREGNGKGNKKEVLNRTETYHEGTRHGRENEGKRSNNGSEW